MNPFNKALVPLPQGTGIEVLGDGTAVGRYLRANLSSVYQPVVESGSGRIAGHEAFVRVHGEGERDISPWSLFSLAAGDDALVALDRLCRIVHALNFRAAELPKRRLFLNVHGRLLVAVREDHGHAFRDAIEGLKLDTRRIVIETPETANLEPKLLALVLSNYRRNGFAVAANVRDLPDLEALLRMVRPDFVKLDARQFRNVGLVRRALDRIRESGARPVFTRVERADQRDFLFGLDGVLVQGRAIADAARLPQRAADARQAYLACAC